MFCKFPGLSPKMPIVCPFVTLNLFLKVLANIPQEKFYEELPYIMNPDIILGKKVKKMNIIVVFSM
jgi:hypothetical protein